MAGPLVELRRERGRPQADLFHIGAVPRLDGAVNSDVPTRGRVPVRPACFGARRSFLACFLFAVMRAVGAHASEIVCEDQERDTPRGSAGDRRP